MVRCVIYPSGAAMNLQTQLLKGRALAVRQAANGDGARLEQGCDRREVDDILAVVAQQQFERPTGAGSLEGAPEVDSVVAGHLHQLLGATKPKRMLDGLE